MKSNKELEALLDLDGLRMVIDDVLGLWVKFEVKVVRSVVRKSGIRYSLSLHDRNNKRILAFDNAHEISFGSKKGVKAKRTYDHWHRDEHDKGRPYHFTGAGNLVADFWSAVDKKIQVLNADGAS